MPRMSESSKPNRRTPLAAMGKAAIVAGLATAVLASQALLAAPAEARTCYMQIKTSGAYRGTVQPGSGVKIKFSPAIPRLPRFTVTRNAFACNQDAYTIDNDSVTGDYDRATMFEVLNLVSGRARNALASHRWKEQDAAMQEFKDWTGKGRVSIAATETVVIGIDIAVKLLEKTLAPYLNFSRTLMIDFVKSLATEYLNGGDGSKLQRFAVDKALALAREIGIKDKETLDKIAAYAIKVAGKVYDAMNKKLKPQTYYASGKVDECEFALTGTIDPRGGKYTVVFDKSCNGGLQDLNSVKLDLTKAAGPGKTVTGTITALGVLGGPVEITAVTGIKAGLMKEERATFAWTARAIGAPGPWTFTFTVADPRWDKSYSVTGKVTGKVGSGTVNGSYRVKNVKPELTLEGAEASAAPDGELVLNLTATVRDKNADDQNPKEVVVKKMTIGPHPGGLDTDKKFDDFTSRTGGAPAKGVYTFTLSRSGTVKGPHEQGEFSAEVCAYDEKEKDCKDVALIVENVAPKVVLSFADPNKVWAGDGNMVDIKIRIQDRNGVDDIVSVSVDAQSAGGGQYSMADGLRETRRTKDSVTYVLATKFAHTDTIGSYPMPIQAADAGTPPKTAAGTATLVVTADAPTVTGIGLLYGGEFQMADLPKRMCPGQIFSFGVIIEGAAGMPKPFPVVTASTGSPGADAAPNGVNMPQTSRNIFTVTMVAPRAPGAYEAIVHAVGIGGKVTVKRLPFSVAICTQPGLQLANNDSALLNAVTGAQVGLAVANSGGAIITPFGNNGPPSALDAATGAVGLRLDDAVATAAAVEADANDDDYGQPGGMQDAALADAGAAAQVATAATAAGSGSPTNGFAGALGQYAGDGGCGLRRIALASGNGLVLRGAGGDVALSVAGGTATGENVTLFGQPGHRVALALVDGGLRMRASHPNGGSCNSMFEYVG